MIFTIPNKETLPIWVIFMNCFLGGVFVISSLGIVLSFAVEVTYPLESAIVHGFVMLGGYGMTFVISSIGTYIGRDDPANILILLGVSGIAGFGFSNLIKEDLRRTKAVS